MKKKIWEKINAGKIALLTIATTPLLTMAADGEYSNTVSISGLWDYLGNNFGKLVNETFDKLATPMGIVISVVFVVAIFFMSIGLIKRGLTNRFRG